MAILRYEGDITVITLKLQLQQVLDTNLPISLGFCEESTLLPQVKHYILDLKGGLKKQYASCMSEVSDMAQRGAQTSS